MSPLGRGVIGVVLGFIIGSGVNMTLITLGATLIPPPAGVDVSSPEQLREVIHLFEPRHYAVPFLAHALGTFAGALVAYLIASAFRARIALGVGVLFLAGGIAASLMIPAPAWFIALDLLVAYLPMAWLAVQAGRRIRGEPVPAQPVHAG